MKFYIYSLLSIFALTSATPFREPRGGRIVGGYAVQIETVPFMAKLYPTGCGGSIISRRHILTAAHCVQSTNPSSLQIIVGTTMLNTDGERYNVVKIKSHPDYDNPRFNNDFAILTLSRDIRLSDKAKIIRLAGAEYKVEAGSEVSVAGWGKLSEHGPVSNQLMRVDVPHVSDEVCHKAYPILTDKMLCAGIAGKDACYGDSGGPLFEKTTAGDYHQVGVVSFGKGCGLPGSPGVYSKVSAMREWINDNMQ